MKHVTRLKIRQGIVLENYKMRKGGGDFHLLFQAHWNNQVSCVANRRQKLRSINKPTLLPLTADPIVLKEYMDDQLSEYMQKCSLEKSELKWVLQLS